MAEQIAALWVAIEWHQERLNRGVADPAGECVMLEPLWDELEQLERYAALDRRD